MDQSEFNDYFENGMKILNGLNLIEFSENNPNITWSGPDFFNLLGFCKEDFNSLRDQPRRLLDSLNHYTSAFSNEIFNRELSYYRYLFRKHISDQEFDEIFKKIPLQPKKEIKDEFGYALLKGKTLTFYIKKLRVIIGRSGKNSSRRFV